MSRDRSPIQSLQDGRLRTPLYHLKRPDSKNPPYCYLGKDKVGVAERFPLLQPALREAISPQQAQQIADTILGAPSLDYAKKRLLSILSRQLSRPQTDEEKQLAIVQSRDELLSAGVPGDYLEDHPEIVEAHANTCPQPDWSTLRHSPEKQPLFTAVLFQNVRLLDEALGNVKEIPSERLSVCIIKWIEFKSDQRRSIEHLLKTRNQFNEFVDFLHDKPVAALTKDDFVRYVSYLMKRQGDYAPQWLNQRLETVKRVLAWAKRKTTLPFPAGLSDWIDFKEDLQKQKKHQSSNKALPTDVFRSLLAKADELAAIDVDQYAALLPIKTVNTKLCEANNKRQSQRVKRFGGMWQAILRYAANTGADNQDICWLTWTHLHLDGETPYVEFSRHKTDVPRMIPLLPETVAAMKRWGEYQPTQEYVFTNDANKQQDRTSVSDGFAKLRGMVEGGDSWCFKHLRKVGPNVGKRNGISRELRDCFLGHAPEGVTAEHYEDACLTPTYLAPLVGIIGQEYFGGAGPEQQCPTTVKR